MLFINILTRVIQRLAQNDCMSLIKTVCTVTDDDQNAAGRPADSSDKKTRFSVSIILRLPIFGRPDYIWDRIMVLIGALTTSEEAFQKKKNLIKQQCRLHTRQAERSVYSTSRFY